MQSTIWNVLGIISIVCLFLFWKKRNAVWGGLSLGFVIGILIATIYKFRGHDFDWIWVKYSCIVGVLTGVIYELVPMLFWKYKEKKIKREIRKQVEDEFENRFNK